MNASAENAESWEIDPAGRIGPLSIGMERPALIGILGEPPSTSGGGGMEFLYYGPLTIQLLEDRVAMLIAELSYGGATPQGLCTGMSLRDVERLVGPLTFDEDAMVWRYVDGDLVGLDVRRPPLSFESGYDGDGVAELYGFKDPEHAVLHEIYLIEPDEA